MASKQVLETLADALFDRWSRDICRIAEETLYFVRQRARYRAFRRMYSRNKELSRIGQDAGDWISHMWGTHALMFVRREMDDQAGVINLRHLLHEIEHRPDVITRDRFMDWARLGVSDATCCWYYHREEERAAKRIFDSFDFVVVPRETEWHDCLDYICPKGVARERERLEAETEKTLRYAQLMVAHRTPKDLDITFGELDKAVDAIDAAVRRYFALLMGEEMTPKRVRSPKEFSQSFRVAWHSHCRKTDFPKPA